MACEGTCRVEQFEWRVRRYEGSYMKPGDSGQEVDKKSTDDQIWQGQDLKDYTQFHPPTLAVWFQTEWQEGVDRVFPRAGRVLDCTDDGCECELGNNPTVVEGWTRWRRYEIVVQFVFRLGANDPKKVNALRFLLKGTVEQRKRIVQGVCRRDPNKTVVAPFAPEELPPRIGESED